jgi:hypothetical protein
MAHQKSVTLIDDNNTLFLATPAGEFLAFISNEDEDSVRLHRWHRVGKYISRSFKNPETGTGLRAYHARSQREARASDVR